MRSSSMSDLKITIKNKTRPIECRKRLTRVLPRCQWWYCGQTMYRYFSISMHFCTQILALVVVRTHYLPIGKKPRTQQLLKSLNLTPWCIGFCGKAGVRCPSLCGIPIFQKQWKMNILKKDQERRSTWETVSDELFKNCKPTSNIKFWEIYSSCFPNIDGVID